MLVFTLGQKRSEIIQVIYKGFIRNGIVKKLTIPFLFHIFASKLLNFQIRQ